MGVPEVRREYATFYCWTCDYMFAGDIPALFEALPACPCCQSQPFIHTILVERFEEGGRWET